MNGLLRTLHRMTLVRGVHSTGKESRASVTCTQQHGPQTASCSSTETNGQGLTASVPLSVYGEG